MKIPLNSLGILGLLLLYSKDIYKHHLSLNDDWLYRATALGPEIGKKVTQYKKFEKVYDNYKFLYIGLALSIIGFLPDIILYLYDLIYRLF